MLRCKVLFTERISLVNHVVTEIIVIWKTVEEELGLSRSLFGKQKEHDQKNPELVQNMLLAKILLKWWR